MSKKKPTALTQQQKLWLIQAFATFLGGCTEVAAAFEKEFGRPISRGHAWQYDAGNPAMRERLSAKWVQIFDHTRQKFLDDTSSIPIANKAWRLRELDAEYRKAKKKERAGQQREILEQAAKEAGDHYTNRRELTGAGGQAIAIETKDTTFDLSKLSREQLDQLEAIRLTLAEPE